MDQAFSVNKSVSYLFIANITVNGLIFIYKILFKKRFDIIIYSCRNFINCIIVRLIHLVNIIIYLPAIGKSVTIFLGISEALFLPYAVAAFINNEGIGQNIVR